MVRLPAWNKILLLNPGAFKVDSASVQLQEYERNY